MLFAKWIIATPPSVVYKLALQEGYTLIEQSVTLIEHSVTLEEQVIHSMNTKTVLTTDE